MTSAAHGSNGTIWPCYPVGGRGHGVRMRNAAARRINLLRMMCHEPSDWMLRGEREADRVEHDPLPELHDDAVGEELRGPGFGRKLHVPLAGHEGRRLRDEDRAPVVQARGEVEPVALPGEPAGPRGVEDVAEVDASELHAMEVLTPPGSADARRRSSGRAASALDQVGTGGSSSSSDSGPRGLPSRRARENRRPSSGDP